MKFRKSKLNESKEPTMKTELTKERNRTWADKQFNSVEVKKRVNCLLDQYTKIGHRSQRMVVEDLYKNHLKRQKVSSWLRKFSNGRA